MALFGLSLLVFNACQKDMQNKLADTQENVYWSAEDLKIKNSILKFQNKINNNTFKSGETLSIDSTIWYIEALMNYNYATPDSSYAKLITDTNFYLEIPIDNEKINFDDISVAFNSVDEYILNYLDEIPSEVKFMIACDVSIEQNNMKGDGSSIKLFLYYGADFITNPGIYTPFQEYDYWTWTSLSGDDGGYCGGPYIGQDVDTGADKEIQYKVNNPNAINNDIPLSTYIVETEIIYVDPQYYINPNDDIPEDNWLDYLMFIQRDNPYTQGYDGYHSCMEPIEMNFYLQGILDIIQMELQTIQNNNPNEDWEFISLELHGEAILDGDPMTLIHEAYISYGRRVFDPNNL